MKPINKKEIRASQYAATEAAKEAKQTAKAAVVKFKYGPNDFNPDALKNWMC